MTVELVHPPIVMVNSCTTIVMVDWQNGMCQSHGCFLQAHVTKQMVKEADAVILYHRYPHIDMYTTGKLLLTRIHPVVPSQPISFPSLLWCLHIPPAPPPLVLRMRRSTRRNCSAQHTFRRQQTYFCLLQDPVAPPGGAVQHASYRRGSRGWKVCCILSLRLQTLHRAGS